MAPIEVSEAADEVLRRGAPDRSRRLILHSYSAAVIVAGAATAWTLARHVEVHQFWNQPALAVLAVLAVVGELRQIVVWHDHERVGIGTSTTFVFAIMLAYGVPTAVLVQLVANIVAELAARTRWDKLALNAAMGPLFIAASGWLLTTFSPLGDGATRMLQARDLPALVLAAAASFLVNQLIITIYIALARGRGVVRQLATDLPFHVLTQAALYALAPIVLAAVEFQLWSVPLLAVPMVVVWKGVQARGESAFLNHHDKLTTLPNRNLLLERIAEAIDSGGQRDLALLLIDLDGFKEVNDTLGHQVGDDLLKLVGSRLQEIASAESVVARLGGDEFAIMLPRAGRDAALRLAFEITTALEEPFRIDELELGIEASIGVALAPDHAQDADALLQKADVAMYHAKDMRSGIEVYDVERDPSNPRRVGMLAELRHAIPNGELVLFYQPKVDLSAGRVVGVEALIRWVHPERGLVPPDDFVPLAERSGLIAPLTDWVATTAIRQIRSWQDRGLDLAVAVNVSIRNLYDRRFPERLHALLEQSGVPASRLKLEITECTLMTDPKRAAPSLQELDDMGIAMSLDDFGTGYSSLTYLKRLPVRELKIDKSFVMNMTQDSQDVAIVRTTIDLGRSLGMRVCAEGVEDQAALELLTFYGCHDAQGFHISRPLPAEQLQPFVDNLHAAHAPLTHGAWARAETGLAVPAHAGLRVPSVAAIPARAS
jgi:diguanylate cyclase (GGDEF)-like protein